MANDTTQLAQKGTGIGTADLTPIIKWFQSLGQGNTNNNTEANDAQVEQQHQALLHPIQKAALDGAVLGTKEIAKQAAMQGGPGAATHIVDTYGGGSPAMSLNNGGVADSSGKQIDPTQLLTGIIAAHLISQKNTSKDSSTSILPPVNNSQQFMPQMNNSLPVKFMEMLGFGTSPEGMLANSQTALNRQRLAAGNPSEIALPQAQAEAAIQQGLQTKQQISGLTPEQQANFNVSMAQNKRETDNQYIQRLDDTIKSHQDYQDTLYKSTNFVGKGDKLAENEAMIKTLQSYRAKRVLKNVTGNTSSVPKGRVPVIAPDGTVGHVPVNQLRDAIIAGYKRG